MLHRFSFVYMLVFGIVLWVLAGIAIFGIAIGQQYSIVQLTDKLYEHPFIANNAARDIRVSSRTAWEYANQIIYHDALSPESLAKIREFEIKTKENFTTLQRSYLGDPKDIRDINADFVALREVYLKAVALTQQGKVEEARSYIETHEGLKRYYQLSDDVNKVIANTQQTAIEYKAQAVGKVHSGMNLLLLLSAISIIIGSIASFILIRYLNLEFHVLKDFARKIERSEFGQMEEVESAFNEFSELKTILNTMAQSLKKSDQEIREAYHQTQIVNTELEESYRHLQEMQSQLVESEKMASLGSLVAGVSHEINTPVGITLTGITHLHELLLKLKKQYENQEMREEDFTRFLHQSVEICDSIELNITRAASLVRSFKQVAVDQSSAEMREFELKEYVEEVLLSLHNKTKKTRHSFSVEIDDSIRLKSFPGAFSQILTNFVTNSLIHGYTGEEAGHIVISAVSDERNVILRYKDDGKGMDEETLKRAFDPFFTTNRENGGSGLGLNIVYNLVTQQLKGKIECKSTPNHGVEFILTLPRTIKQGKN